MNTTCTVSKEWLFEHMNDSDVMIADCRFDLKDAKAGREAYRKSHIPGAMFFDLKNDLSGTVGTHGGRHPLPDPEVFAQQLREKGINKEKHVVIYETIMVRWRAGYGGCSIMSVKKTHRLWMRIFQSG